MISRLMNYINKAIGHWDALLVLLLQLEMSEVAGGSALVNVVVSAVFILAL
jgi:hypothetical protein